MGAASFVLPSTYADTTNLRSWISNIRAALASFGLVRTNDTGQVDVTTVVTSGSNNVYFGYDIYRFNDALQITHPVFFRLEYYNCSFSFTRPSLGLYLGTGSNGAGSLINPSGFFRSQAIPDVEYTHRAHKLRIHGTPSSLYLWYGMEDTQCGMICVDRLRDLAGQQTDKGIVAYIMGGQLTTVQSNSTTCVYLYQNNSYRSSLSGSNGGLFPDISNAIHLGPLVPDITIATPLIYVGKAYTFNLFSCLLNDIPVLTTFQVPVFGQNKTLLRVGSGNGTTSATTGTCILFE